MQNKREEEEITSDDYRAPVIAGIMGMNCIRASPAQLQPSQTETHAPVTAGEQVEARDKKSGSTAINHGTCPCDTLAPSGKMNC